MKYTNGKKVIEATKRAFEVVYKDQGFKPYKEKEDNEKKGSTSKKTTSSKKKVDK